MISACSCRFVDCFNCSTSSVVSVSSFCVVDLRCFLTVFGDVRGLACGVDDMVSSFKWCATWCTAGCSYNWHMKCICRWEYIHIWMWLICHMNALVCWGLYTAGWNYIWHKKWVCMWGVCAQLDGVLQLSQEMRLYEGSMFTVGWNYICHMKCTCMWGVCEQQDRLTIVTRNGFVSREYVLHWS